MMMTISLETSRIISKIISRIISRMYHRVSKGSNNLATLRTKITRNNKVLLISMISGFHSLRTRIKIVLGTNKSRTTLETSILAASATTINRTIINNRTVLGTSAIFRTTTRKRVRKRI